MKSYFCRYDDQRTEIDDIADILVSIICKLDGRHLP